MRRVLLLSAETPSAVALVRGLHDADLRAEVLARSRLSPAGLSWRCHRADVVGRWDGAALLQRITSDAPDLVLPVTEEDLAYLAPVRAAVEERVPVLAPAAAVLERATDKVDGIAAVAAAGVAVPEQWVLRADDDGASLPADAFPLVAKPGRSRVLTDDGTVAGGTAGYVVDRAALARVRAEHRAAGLATVVQPPLAGHAEGVALLLDPDGRLVAQFCHRRVRELHPEGGPSACAVSIAPRAALVDAAVAAARALGLVGVPAQFEFRVTPDRGDVLLDVNPRPWGTLGLARAAGVNFYGTAIQARLGGAWPDAPPDYATGVFRHVGSFEIRRSLRALFGRPQAGYTGPWPTALDALTSWIVPPWQGLVGTLDDPLPALGDALRLIAAAVRR